MARTRYRLDDRVVVDFFGDGEEKLGEIDAVDFRDDPAHPYRVWYDAPRIEPTWGNHPPIEIESEWVSEQQITRVNKQACSNTK